MYALIGLLTGVLTGLGLGGGVILIPILVMLGTSQPEAQAINIISYIVTATITIIVQTKKDTIDKETVKKLMPMTIIAFVFCVIGAMLVFRIDTKILKKIYAVFLFTVGLKELLSKN